MRQSFVSIVWESIQDVRRASQRAKQIALLDARFKAALTRLNSGNAGEMELLASESLGDAWMSLARHLSEHGAADNADELTTRAFAQAATSEYWISDVSGYAKEQYETRWFLGIGVTPDYRELFRLWQEGHIPGDGREIELAWLHTFGSPEFRNLKTAWRWMCLAEARHGSREPPMLPTGDFQLPHDELTGRLLAKTRERVQVECESQAHAEFVSTR